MCDTRDTMVSRARSSGDRESSNSGLRVLVRRSRGVLRRLSDALAQEDAPTSAPPYSAEDSALNHQVTEAVELTQNLHARFALLEQRVESLSDKIELLGARLNDPTRVEGEGTLRPPKVPQGLDATSEPPGAVPGFNSRSFVSPAEPRPRSGFVREPEANLRAPRSGAGPSLSGHMTGLSLSSLFSLFEFERSSGSLTIQHGERRLDLLLRGGRVVRCELDGVRTAATASVREVFAWSQSTFTFRRDPEHDDVDPPQSVNALMLDAMRFHDEELRTG